MPTRQPSRTTARRRPAVRPADAGLPDGRCRVVVERVKPEVDGGRFPVKRTVGESVRVTAWIHADGHDVLAAALRYRALPARGGGGDWTERPMHPLGNDEWTAAFEIDRQCAHEYTVAGWIDAFASWRKGLAAKLDAKQDVSSELVEGAALVRGVAARARGARSPRDAQWLDAQAGILEESSDISLRARTALDDRLAAAVDRFPDRSHAAEYERVLQVSVDRERARFGAWYEMFPRSWGPDPARSATFGEAEAHLPRVAAMGFDVVYLPPVHPIGKAFRKGPGNTLKPGPGDPGSPWAIGSDEGGHKAVEPGLGTLGDFDRFVRAARRLGLETALDIAFQCSPDHPYVREHPEWFRHRPDGTIKYAENPPKKYQDIYPFDFECDEWPALWAELKSVVEFWIGHGVTIFRVDNPHTKPYRFWEWLIREVRADHPDVIFLAEAFARPKIMYRLAKLGFNQSYTYFTWRNTKEELADYFTELTGTDVADYFRPNLFANTPDILHAYLQDGGPPAFRIRLVLAATLGATYGIYSGFELCENRPAAPGSEEYFNSEKYQFRQWDWNRPDHIRDLVTAVNRIRHEHPALHADRGLQFCETDNPNILAYVKSSPDGSDRIFVVVNLDYEHMQHGWVRVPLDPMRGTGGAPYEVTDLLDGRRYTWRGDRNYVRLDPRSTVAHVFELPAAVPVAISQTDGALAEFLPRQRWFAGKAQKIAGARLFDWATGDPLREGVTPLIAEVRYADGGDERYFMPVAVVPDADARAARSDGRAVGRTPDATIVDALADDEACRALVAAMLDGRSMAMRDGTIRATAYGAPAEMEHWPISRRSADQSNSCVVFGDRYVLKVLRRLEAGPNPELEISRFLTERGVTCIPPLAGGLEYERPGEERTSLALLQQFVPNEGTAWDWAVADVRQRLLRGTAPSAADLVGFRTAASTLGRRTAELHFALAGGDSDPAFSPEQMTGAHVAALVARLHEDVERSMRMLENRLESLPAPAQRLARAVLAARRLLGARIDAFSSLPAGSMRIRVHGDYHLGQVLRTGQDFVIIDFEGEPARPLAERRAKQSPMKDVAGMLRSFSYAAYATLFTESDPEDLGRTEAAARLWEAEVSAEFLTDYRQTLAHGAVVPGDADHFARLLEVFTLEKALYELRYELASRPQWVGIPLMAMMQVVGEAEARTVKG